MSEGRGQIRQFRTDRNCRKNYLIFPIMLETNAWYVLKRIENFVNKFFSGLLKYADCFLTWTKPLKRDRQNLNWRICPPSKSTWKWRGERKNCGDGLTRKRKFHFRHWPDQTGVETQTTRDRISNRSQSQPANFPFFKVLLRQHFAAWKLQNYNQKIASNFLLIYWVLCSLWSAKNCFGVDNLLEALFYSEIFWKVLNANIAPRETSCLTWKVKRVSF